MKRLKKDILSFTTAGIASGVGAAAVSKAGGDTSAFTSMSEMMGPLGSMVGAGAVMRQTRKLGKIGKRR